MKIAVIGAGLSGLTAAVRFQQAGHDVCVLDLNHHAGGRCKALHRNGFIIDTCPELAATSYRRWLALIREVGLGSEIVQCPTVISLLQDGRLIDIDMGNPLSIAFSPVISWSAKARFARGIVGMRKQLRSVPHYLLDDVSLDDPASGAEQLSLRAFGPEVTRKLIEPLLRPIGGVTLDMMSTMLVPYTLSDWTQMVTLRGGLDILPMALAQRFQMHLGTTVRQIHSAPSGVTLDCVDANGSAGTMTADKCLVTAPYDQAEAIYPRFAEISGGYRKTMRFMRLFDVKLAYGKATTSKAASVMLSVRESPRINVISLAHNKAPDRAPPGHSLFSIFTEHKEYETFASMPAEDIVTLMRQEIERLYPEVRGRFLFSYVSAQERVSYVPDAGFFHRTRRLWDAIGEEPRVQLGGDLFMFGGMEAAVATGERAAERLMRA